MMLAMLVGAALWCSGVAEHLTCDSIRCVSGKCRETTHGPICFVPLEEGDVCRSGGGTSGYIMDRSKECPKGTECRVIAGAVAVGGEVPHTCQPAGTTTTNPCWTMRCMSGTECRVGVSGKAECVKVEFDCATREMWTAEKSEWCCRNKQMGCPHPIDPTKLPVVDPCHPNPCAKDEECRAESKQCITTPCPQHVCVKREGLKEGDVCRSGGETSGYIMDRSKECPKGTECRVITGVVAIGGEVVYTCQPAGTTVANSCAAVLCMSGAECRVGASGKAECVKVEKEPFDCRTEEVWTAVKTEWCCRNKQMGCPSSGNPCEKAPCGKGEVCVHQREVCVKTPCLQYTCVAAEYDCTTKELWAEDKQKWCCTMKKLGCGTDRVVLAEGDVCRRGGVTSGAEIDMSTHCPERTECRPKEVQREMGGETHPASGSPVGGEALWTCQAPEEDPCMWVKCPGVCEVTATGKAQCKEAENPCALVDCLAEFTCRVKEGKAKCVEKVVDPCQKCQRGEVCELTSTGAECRVADRCAMALLAAGLDDCLPPLRCVETKEGKAECVRPDTECDKERCEREGKKCGASGMCVKDLCQDFTWPVAGTQFCSEERECASGFECTGCTPTCRCDPETGRKVCARDCRRTCRKKEFKCDEGEKGQWSAKEQAHCCQAEGKGCVEYACSEESKTRGWGAEQRAYCCKAMGRGCLAGSEKFDCRGSGEGWGAEQRKWCCAEKRVGCLPLVRGLYSCDGEGAEWSVGHRTYCCRMEKKGCRCDESVSATSEEEKRWCCKVKGTFCPRKEEYDCEGSVGSMGTEQRVWCCAKHKVGCPVTCNVGVERRERWTEAERKFCCLFEKVGCKEHRYECLGGEDVAKWSAGKREWCCDEHDVGCEYDCTTAPELLEGKAKAFCCKAKGVCPGEVRPTPKPAGKPWEQYRLKLRGSWESIARNPKRFVRKLRMTLLKASQVLRTEPSRLLVTFVGPLLRNMSLPSGGYGLPVPPEMNNPEATLPAAVQMPTAEDGIALFRGARRGATTLADSVGQLLGADGSVWVDYVITAENKETVTEASKEVDESIRAAVRGSGPLRDNSEGSTLVFSGGEVARITSGAPEEEKGSSPSWLWVLLSALTGVFAVAAVGTVYHRRRGNDATTEYTQQLAELVQLKSSVEYDSGNF